MMDRVTVTLTISYLFLVCSVEKKMVKNNAQPEPTSFLTYSIHCFVPSFHHKDLKPLIALVPRFLVHYINSLSSFLFTY